MTLAEQMESAALEIFLQTDEMAETISYTPSGSSSRNIPAIVERGEDIDTQETDRGLMVTKTASLHISDDATQGVPSPTNEDTLVIDGVTYRVTGRPEPPFAGIQVITARSATPVKMVNPGSRPRN